MIGFVYHLVFGAHPGMVVRIERGGKMEPLYREDFQRSLKDKELLAQMMRAEYTFRKVSLQSAEIVPLQEIHIPSESVQKMLVALGATGRLFAAGKRIIVDPFKRVPYKYTISSIEGGNWLVEGEIEGGSCGVIHADPPWVLQLGILRMLCSGKTWFLEEPKIVAPSAQERFQDKLDIPDAPVVTWKIQESVQRELLPFLVLKDRFGACADLWMDYKDSGKICVHDPIKTPWRRPLDEKMWEKDLLETDFIYKPMGSSFYYCPMDRVGESLTFLLEVGWKIIDFQGRQIVRKGDLQLSCEETRDALVLRGSVKYGEHLVDIEHVMGAFNRRESFIELSAGYVGLVDHAQCAHIGEIKVKKSHFATLEDILPEEMWHKTCGKWVQRQEALPSERFLGKLHPYQQEGVDWLDWLFRSGFSGLLADAMGLGKTVQVLAFLSRVDPLAKVLIVTPTSLLFNWRAEIEKFLPGGLPGLVLTSYALLRRDYLSLQKTEFQAIFLDEAQYIKNPSSQVAQCAYKLRGKMRVAMTGTPVENRWDELWSLYAFLAPELLGDRKTFQAQMLMAQQDSRHLKRLHKKIAPFLLRRSKERIADQLPEKYEQLVWVEMVPSQRDAYEQLLAYRKKDLLNKIAKDGASAHRMEVLELILRLRQVCCDPRLIEGEEPGGKLEQLMLDLESVAAEGKKAIIYSQFTQMLQLIAASLREKGWSYAYLDGSSKDREESVRIFQEDSNVPFFLVSLKAGGVGLNLTAADYVFLFDPWWNDAVEQQAIDRAHRLGRKQCVIARRYITPMSIEEKLLNLKSRKSALAAGLLKEESIPSSITEADLLSLLS